jgi:trans-aconitate methyltransferase
MPSVNSVPKLYTGLASWFHLLTHPADYAEEAAFVTATLDSADHSIRTVLELGSGGGNNAFHLKTRFDMTLLDLSPEMLQLSGTINPECEHIVGDMRTARLNRRFDAVFVHDAVMYLTTSAELRQCLETAFLHCKRGGAALFMPDFVKETYSNGVHHGGHDAEGRSLRHFEWTYDTDPSDSVYSVDFVYMLRERGLPLRIEHDAHTHGLFERDVWLRLLREAGFTPQALDDPYGRCVFLART